MQPTFSENFRRQCIRRSSIDVAVSRALTRLELCLNVGKLLHGLFHIRWEVRDLLHLANFDDFIVRSWAAFGPFDRFFSGFHLNHPVAAEYLLRLGEGVVGHLGLLARERYPSTHRRWV